MTSDGIFLQSAAGLTLLEQRPYDSEKVLQSALANYPEILAGPTTAGDDGGGLILVSREVGPQTPGEPGESTPT